jgi:energy-coupling factor transporter ATP-binding protein EcfA2
MLILEPEVLILDEPTTGLDRRDTENLMALLRRFVREKGITVIQVSHDMEQVAEFATRAVVLNEGRIVFDGTPENLFENSALLAECKLGAPPVAVLSQRLWPGQPIVPITVGEFFGEVK